MPRQATDERSRPPEPRFHFLRNRCSTSRNPCSTSRNRCSTSAGIDVPLPPDSVFHFRRNTQFARRLQPVAQPVQQPAHRGRTHPPSLLGQRRRQLRPTLARPAQYPCVKGWIEGRAPPPPRVVNPYIRAQAPTTTCRGPEFRTDPSRPSAATARASWTSAGSTVAAGPPDGVLLSVRGRRPHCRAVQHDRVLTAVKARRFAPPPLRGADGLDTGCAHGRRPLLPDSRGEFHKNGGVRPQQADTER